MKYPLNIADYFECMAREHPYWSAIVCEDAHISWQQYNTLSNCFATELLESGVGPRDLVALHTSNSIGYFIALLGALKISAIPFNSDTSSAVTNTQALWNYCDAKAVIYTSDTSASARLALVGAANPPVGIEVDGFVRSTSCVPQAPNVRGYVRRTGDDPIVKCSSGTTEHPRALLWRQRDLLRNILMYGSEPRGDLNVESLGNGTARPNVFVASPLTHGSGQMRALASLVRGGSVVCIRGRFDSEKAVDLIAREGCDSVAIVGDVHSAKLANSLGKSSAGDLGRLKVISSSGSKWSRERRSDLVSLIPDLRLIETIGATEAAGLGFAISSREGIPDTGVFRLAENAAILDEKLECVPPRPGNVGRLAGGGLQARGHLQNTELDERIFVKVAGCRYALSSDLGVWLGPGVFRHLGRVDDAVDVAGNNVYLSIVESRAQEIQGIGAVALAALSGDGGSVKLAALIETEDGTNTTAAEVESAWRCLFARHETPELIVFGKIPRNRLGKILRGRCREILERCV